MPREITWTGRRLRDARHTLTRPDGKPVTQADLARMIGASARSVTSWEAGTATPHPHTAARLDELFPEPAPTPAEEDRTNPRIKQAGLAELMAEIMVRVAQLEAQNR